MCVSAQRERDHGLQSCLFWLNQGPTATVAATALLILGSFYKRTS